MNYEKNNNIYDQIGLAKSICVASGRALGLWWGLTFFPAAVCVGVGAAGVVTSEASLYSSTQEIATFSYVNITAEGVWVCVRV